jgi:alpha-L-fucosidase 2
MKEQGFVRFCLQALSATLLLNSSVFAAADGANLVQRYNYSWDSLSTNATGSMPVGNGDLAANVYVCDGALYLLLSKSDAFDGQGNLIKTGRIKVSLSPNPFAPGKPFRQTLDVVHGCVRIQAGDAEVRVWVDANCPVYHINIHSPNILEVTTTPEFWPRKDGHPDVQNREGQGICWYHANQESVFAKNLKYYDIENMAATHPDPFLNLTVGCLVESPGLKLVAGQLIGRAKNFDIRIHSLAMKTPDAAKWVAAIRKLAVKNQKTSDWQAHCHWWNDFWNRSWIVASDNTLPASQREVCVTPSRTGWRSEPDGGYVVAQHYNIQRYMMACQSRGGCQVEFNGGLFTTPMHLTNPSWNLNQDFGPDERLWGNRFTFQNQRLLYWPMLAAGDDDLFQPFFNYYSSLLDLRKATTRAWFGHEGAYYRENVQLGGDEIDDSKGSTPNKPPKFKPGEDKDGWYHNYHFLATLELPWMMLQYERFTGDRKFRDQVLLPMARECLRFYDQHYARDNCGKLRIEPSQVLETWWFAVNPAPDVAGLQALLDGLLTLDGLPQADRESWARLRGEIPEVPMREVAGKPVIAPAEQYSHKGNDENGELYPVFPFDLFGVAHGNAQIVRDTMSVRTVKDANGGRCWSQDEIDYACAGMADEARAGLEKRFRTYSDLMRFPMFAREFPDYVPDFDSNGSGSVALQKMLLQEGDGKIYLLPAWPKEWDVNFKLHASGNTTVECA